MLLNLERSPRLGGLCLTGVCLVLLLAVGGHAAAQPLGWWTFGTNRVKGATVVDRAGKHDGSIQGEIRLTQGPFAALALDGEANSVDVPNVQAADLPARALSIEAWVSLDAGLAWGGIAGYFQDNGSFEKGWLLGYDETHFSFAVSASGRLTYLKGATPFFCGAVGYVASNTTRPRFQGLLLCWTPHNFLLTGFAGTP